MTKALKARDKNIPINNNAWLFVSRTFSAILFCWVFIFQGVASLVYIAPSALQNKHFDIKKILYLYSVYPMISSKGGTALCIYI
jgi:hypothetical protein